MTLIKNIAVVCDLKRDVPRIDIGLLANKSLPLSICSRVLDIESLGKWNGRCVQLVRGGTGPTLSHSPLYSLSQGYGTSMYVCPAGSARSLRSCTTAQSAQCTRGDRTARTLDILECNCIHPTASAGHVRLSTRLS